MNKPTLKQTLVKILGEAQIPGSLAILKPFLINLVKSMPDDKLGEYMSDMRTIVIVLAGHSQGMAVLQKYGLARFLDTVNEI